MYRISLLLFLTSPIFSAAQKDNGFPAGATYSELEMTSYPADTSANAVVLNEFGEASIDNDGDNNLLLEYHVKIKILKKAGG